MDPTANLKEQRELVVKIEKRSDLLAEAEPDHQLELREAMAEDAERLAELAKALDEWICNGGFLPQPWSKAQRP